jgi:uncharacterized protein YbjQ (UPF0145 family)
MVFAGATSYAEDQVKHYPVKHALGSKVGKTKLLKYVRIYMKGADHPGVERRNREYKTSKRSSGANHSPQEACDVAFVSALIALQERADREGGNAVIDIYSLTKNDRYQNTDKYVCTTGRAMANVVLKGTVATLGN